MTQLNDSEIEELKEKLHQLQLEHRDLDDIITLLQQDPYPDQLKLKRFKTRKLLLKDMIAKLESLIIPDLNA